MGKVGAQQNQNDFLSAELQEERNFEGAEMSTTDTEITFFGARAADFIGVRTSAGVNDLTITYRNIWGRPEAAEFVNHAQGNEVVPTVQIGSQYW